MITILAGTNRVGSNTRAVAKIAERELQKQGVKTQFCDLAELPEGIFSPKHYFNPPKEFAPFQKMIVETDGVLTVVPEYNGSFPGAFKYFIDLLKFPESLNGMPCAFIGVAAGNFGAMRSIEQLEQIYRYRGAFLFPRFVIMPKVDEKLNAEKTEITDEFSRKLFNQLLTDFPEFSGRFKRGK